MRGQGSFSFNSLLSIVLIIIGAVIILGLYFYFSEGSRAAIENIVFGHLDKLGGSG